MCKKVNIADIEWHESTQDDFSYLRKQLGSKAGGKMLGASLYKLAPGKKAFPFHCHYANEEAILIISGKGTVRIGSEETPIVKNDYIALPSGAEYAHQVINTSSEALEYLCISTMIDPEVMEYPDSKKIGIMTESPPGGDKKSSSYKAFFQKNTDVPYYEDEI